VKWQGLGVEQSVYEQMECLWTENCR